MPTSITYTCAHTRQEARANIALISCRASSLDATIIARVLFPGGSCTVWTASDVAVGTAFETIDAMLDGDELVISLLGYGEPRIEVREQTTDNKRWLGEVVVGF